jgi:hypothetical protein
MTSAIAVATRLLWGAGRYCDRSCCPLLAADIPARSRTPCGWARVLGRIAVVLALLSAWGLDLCVACIFGGHYFFGCRRLGVAVRPGGRFASARGALCSGGWLWRRPDRASGNVGAQATELGERMTPNPPFESDAYVSALRAFRRAPQQER